jgi:hypothetical protein
VAALHDTALQDLERLAQGATPGPWAIGRSEYTGRPIVRREDGERIAGVYRWSPGDGDMDEGPRDAAYIAAASPDVVLSLVAAAHEAARLRAALEVIVSSAGMRTRRSGEELAEMYERVALKALAPEVMRGDESDEDRTCCCQGYDNGVGHDAWCRGGGYYR